MKLIQNLIAVMVGILLTCTTYAQTCKGEGCDDPKAQGVVARLPAPGAKAPPPVVMNPATQEIVQPFIRVYKPQLVGVIVDMSGFGNSCMSYENGEPCPSPTTIPAPVLAKMTPVALAAAAAGAKQEAPKKVAKKAKPRKAKSPPDCVDADKKKK